MRRTLVPFPTGVPFTYVPLVEVSVRRRERLRACSPEDKEGDEGKEGGVKATV
jgi:hypothetical protein